MSWDEFKERSLIWRAVSWPLAYLFAGLLILLKYWYRLRRAVKGTER
jgi:hypothetical protein